jgi:hypothetical protein
MAHKSLIVCDGCGKEGRVGRVPYPPGWTLVGVTQWKMEDGGPVNKDHKDCDLCPDCSAPVLASLGRAITDGASVPPVTKREL